MGLPSRSILHGRGRGSKPRSREKRPVGNWWTSRSKVFFLNGTFGTPLFGSAHADLFHNGTFWSSFKKIAKRSLYILWCDPEGGPITPTFGDYSPLLRGHQRRVSYIFAITAHFLRSGCGVSAITAPFLCHRIAMLTKGEREGDGEEKEGKEDGREKKSNSLYISPPPDRPPLRRLYW